MYCMVYLAVMSTFHSRNIMYLLCNSSQYRNFIRKTLRILLHIFTVLCLYAAIFLHLPRREICGYLTVKIYTNFGVRIQTYRASLVYTRVNTGPDDVPYPIEPTRSALRRHTIGFQIGPRQSAVETTWRRPRRRRPEWSCFARAADPHPAKCTKRES